MNPVPYISAFARPGGRWSPVRIIAMILLLALVVLLLFKILKPVFEFFGFGDKGGGSNGSTQKVESPIDDVDVEKGKNTTSSEPSALNPPEDWSYLEVYVEDLHAVINDWGASYDGVSNCSHFQRINALLDNNELRIVNNNYRRNFAKSLRQALQNMSFTGCEWYWFPGTNDDYAKILIERLKSIEYND